MHKLFIRSAEKSICFRVIIPFLKEWQDTVGNRYSSNSTLGFILSDLELSSLTVQKEKTVRKCLMIWLQRHVKWYITLHFLEIQIMIWFPDGDYIWYRNKKQHAYWCWRFMEECHRISKWSNGVYVGIDSIRCEIIVNNWIIGKQNSNSSELYMQKGLLFLIWKWCLCWILSIRSF